MKKVVISWSKGYEGIEGNGFGLCVRGKKCSRMDSGIGVAQFASGYETDGQVSCFGPGSDLRLLPEVMLTIVQTATTHANSILGLPVRLHLAK
jgi:hypothetical protein